VAEERRQRDAQRHDGDGEGKYLPWCCFSQRIRASGEHGKHVGDVDTVVMADFFGVHVVGAAAATVETQAHTVGFRSERAGTWKLGRMVGARMVVRMR
jgi:hypothetical protein